MLFYREIWEFFDDKTNFGYYLRSPYFPADMVTYTEEILDKKLHFLYSVRSS